MSDPTIAFLPQPVQTLAYEGRDFASRVISTLQGWVVSKHTANVVQHVEDEIYILSEKLADWNMVVIGRGKATVEVCAVGFSKPDILAAQYKALAHVEHLASIMQVRLDKIEPEMFSAVAGSYTMLTKHWDPTRDETGLAGPGDWLQSFDHANRWASSKARNNFKALMDDARFRPQIVERDNDDLFVVSRRYFWEMVRPTSARELSRRYAEMALSDAGMPDAPLRILPPLEPLPELGDE